jgi:DEAD/DEAH box helicase domain-containing protein
VDDDKLPFGFEYLKRATFREVNFGESSDQGRASLIAGRETVRPGFELCARCGKVQRPDREPEHALSCPSNKPGAKQQIEACLYLYREFASEALRLLLPLADMSTTKQLHSFVAALQVGLEERFGGSVDHLHTTVYSDPVEGGTLRKQYLVIFDTVPGGTGYLKQLITPQSEGGEMPLFEAMDMARKRIESCLCWSDPDRDGCYRCLYAFRSASDMDDTSAQVASDLLRRILAGRGKLLRIASLGEISITGLLESALEVRFVEALRQISNQDGRTAKLKPAVVNKKPGYRWTLGDAEWVVEPQVVPPVSESGRVPVSIDFVMRPATASGDRRLAIFLDGWTFQKDRIAKDLYQRMALLATGTWDVWTFTWADLDQPLAVDRDVEVPELAVTDPTRLKKFLQQMGRPECAPILQRPVFSWFEAELMGDGLPWPEIAKAVLAARMVGAQAVDGEAWLRFVERVAPPVAQPGLAAKTPLQIAHDQAGSNPFVELVAVHDGAEAALVCSLDDRQEHRQDPQLKTAWHGYLRLFQLLRRIDNAWFMTRTSPTEGDAYRRIAAARGAVPEEAPWSGLDEIEPDYLGLARALMGAGVREPEIGMEIPDTRGDTWAEAELLWEKEQVAVTSQADTEHARGNPAGGWEVLCMEDLADDPAPVIEALGRTEESS